jgi:CRP/FNR family transcriptional regulator
MDMQTGVWAGRTGRDEVGRSCNQCGVRASAICSSLDPSALAEFSRLGRRTHILAGQTLMWEGDESIVVGNVIEGMLKLSTFTGDGREQIVGIVYPSDFIGRPFGRDSHYSVTALTDASLCVFGRGAFDRFAREHCDVEHALLARTLTELDRARRWMLLLGRKSACERVASLILEMDERLNTANEIALPLSRQQMADVLGLTIETVSRSLTKLKHARIISLPGARRLTIEAPEKLRRIAEG